MNWADEREAFERRVKANFTTAPVQYPGTPLAPPSSGAWVRMQLLPGWSKRITLGPNALYRERGTLLFMIFTQMGRGSKESRQIADELSEIFHEAIFSYGNSGTIRCEVPEVDARGPSADGVWYQLNLSVKYERDVNLT